MKTEQFKIRATKNELAFISNAAKIAGTNKSQFILDAAKNAAKKLGMNIDAYFVSEFENSPQNTRTSSFSSAGNQRIDHGVGNGASTGRGAIDGGASKGRSASPKAKPTGSEKKRSV